MLFSYCQPVPRIICQMITIKALTLNPDLCLAGNFVQEFSRSEMNTQNTQFPFNCVASKESQTNLREQGWGQWCCELPASPGNGGFCSSENITWGGFFSSSERPKLPWVGDFCALSISWWKVMLIPLGKKSLWTTRGWLQTHFYCGCSHRAQSRTSFLPEQLLFPQCMEQETHRWWENKDPSAETWSDSGMNQRHKSGVNTNSHRTPGSGGKPGSGILVCVFLWMYTGGQQTFTERLAPQSLPWHKQMLLGWWELSVSCRLKSPIKNPKLL